MNDAKEYVEAALSAVLALVVILLGFAWGWVLPAVGLFWLFGWLS